MKQIVILGFLSLAAALNSNAHESDRIANLEKKLKEMEGRLSKLESLAIDTSKAIETIVSIDGWKSLANWRKLNKDMNTSDVKNILGDPYRVNGGSFTRWSYKNSGEVVFYEDKVYLWREPE